MSLRIKLTERQIDVLVEAAAGHGAKDTARNLGVSIETVKDHRSAAIARLGASCMTSAVAIALMHGHITRTQVESLWEAA